MKDFNIAKAYKLKKASGIWDYIAKIKEQVYYEMETILFPLYDSWVKNRTTVETLSSVFNMPVNEINYKQCSEFILLNNMQIKSGKETESNKIYNLDVKIKVIFHEKNFYLVPQSSGIFEKVFDFMLLDKEVDEYSYNSFRRSPRISEEEWEERRAIWDEIYNKTDSGELALEFNVINMEKFHLVDPFYENARKNAPTKTKRFFKKSKPATSVKKASTNVDSANKPKAENSKSTSQQSGIRSPKKRNISSSGIEHNPLVDGPNGIIISAADMSNSNSLEIPSSGE